MRLLLIMSLICLVGCTPAGKEVGLYEHDLASDIVIITDMKTPHEVDIYITNPHHHKLNVYEVTK